MLRSSRSYLITLLVLTILTTASFFWKGLPGFLDQNVGLRETLLVLPYFLLGLLAFLGARMHQYRILGTALLFALVYALLTRPNPWAGTVPWNRTGLLAIAVPLSLIGLGFVKMGRLWSRGGAILLGVIVAPFLVEWIFAAATPGFTKRVLTGQFISWPPSWNWKIPDLALFLAIAFAGSIAWVRDRYLKEFQVAATVAHIPLFVLLSRSWPGPTGDAAIFVGIGVLLLYGMYHLYWSKVYIDELTGIPNRRALDERLAQLDHGYWIAMADIDHFKKFNDRHGHEEGDNVLRFVAAHLQDKTGGRAYRYGGEEFCVIFDDLAPDEVVNTLEGARKSLAARDFFIRGSRRKQGSAKDRKAHGSAVGGGALHRVKVTVSIGAAPQSVTASAPTQVIKLADQLLYKAKDRGRNQVVAET